LLLFLGCGGSNSENVNNLYYLHKNITVTNFYVGELASSENGYIPNIASAWDGIWLWDFGGVDDVNDRNKTYIYFPSKFIPSENPFYFALPYNDLDENGTPKPTQKLIPWYKQESNTTILKNRWIKIIKHTADGDKIAYAQWEDVGPFEEDDFDYVFGTSIPKNQINNNAGLDVSPAVKYYLNLDDIDKVDWQFVDYDDVPDGPWKQIITTTPAHWPEFAYIDNNSTWYMQLDGNLLNIDADIYIVDLFKSTSEDIENIKPKVVICYFSAGVVYDSDYDRNNFLDEILGYSYNGGYWVNIKAPLVRKLMIKRLDYAKGKGCDGVVVDNVDEYYYDNGFNITYIDQFNYNRILSIEAKKRSLLIGYVNDLNQIADIAIYNDFHVSINCYINKNCNKLDPFILMNKPVLDIEFNDRYKKNDAFKKLCEFSKKKKIFILVLSKKLNGRIVKVCRNGLKN
jgi:hypothetical protein